MWGDYHYPMSYQQVKICMRLCHRARAHPLNILGCDNHSIKIRNILTNKLFKCHGKFVEGPRPILGLGAMLPFSDLYRRQFWS